MKSTLLIAAAAALFLSLPIPPVHAADAEPRTEAVVKKIDADGQVTLTHGPIENLGMGGMTMRFAVKDKALPKGVKPGDKLRVRIEDIGGTYTVVRAVPAQ